MICCSFRFFGVSLWLASLLKLVPALIATTLGNGA